MSTSGKRVFVLLVRFYIAPSEYDEKAVRKHFKGPAMQVLESAHQRFRDLDSWSADTTHDVIHAIAESIEIGLGKAILFMKQ